LIVPEFIRKSRIQAPAARIFAWHEEPGAFERLTPPGEPVRLLRQPERLGGGARAEILVGRWPLRIRWIAEHINYRRDPATEHGGETGGGGGEFTDVQIKGPFKSWRHRHIVEADGPDACTLTDHIQYELPLGLIGRLLGGWIVRRKLDRMFDYRHRITREDNETPAMGPSASERP
jgi:ligand-binding SRPBCC domain-containing protein